MNNKDHYENQKMAEIGRKAMNIQMIDAVMKTVDSDGNPLDGTAHPYVFLYNMEKISREEVERLLTTGEYLQDSRILQTDPETAANIFPHRGESKKDKIRKYWKPRTYANDITNCECSGCGFKVSVTKAVKLGKTCTDYIDVKYHFCPNCGSPMTYKLRESEDECNE